MLVYDLLDHLYVRRLKSDNPSMDSELQPATYCFGVFGGKSGFGVKALVDGIAEFCNDGERRKRQFCNDPKMDEKYAEVKRKVC